METVILEFSGGPCDGRLQVQMEWPPEAVLQVSGTSEGFDHVYVRQSMSDLPPHPSILRGAIYEWWPSDKWRDMLREQDTFDPDANTYAPHTYTPSQYGRWCSVCGRELMATLGAFSAMHTDAPPESEARAMDGNR